MHRRLLVSSLTLAALALAGCSGSSASSDDASQATPTSAVATTAAAPKFACPVTREQLEAAYPRVTFEDSTSTTDQCTFRRFGESGTVVIRLDPGGAPTFATAAAKLRGAVAVAGVGYEAVYDGATSTLVARTGDHVLVLANSGVSGFVGVADQSAALRDASIALAKVVVGPGA